MKSLFEEDKKRVKLPVSLIIVCITVGSAIYFYTQEDYATAVAIALVGMALRSGYRLGAATYFGFLAGGALSPLGIRSSASVLSRVCCTASPSLKTLSQSTWSPIIQRWKNSSRGQNSSRFGNN